MIKGFKLLFRITGILLLFMQFAIHAANLGHVLFPSHYDHCHAMEGPSPCPSTEHVHIYGHEYLNQETDTNTYRFYAKQKIPGLLARGKWRTSGVPVTCRGDHCLLCAHFDLSRSVVGTEVAGSIVITQSARGLRSGQAANFQQTILPIYRPRGPPIIA
ncbi:MAG: hypothetical protein WA705_00155 [Candidatus Ozemobacteraceae bacterium]